MAPPIIPFSMVDALSPSRNLWEKASAGLETIFNFGMLIGVSIFEMLYSGTGAPEKCSANRSERGCMDSASPTSSVPGPA